MKIKIQPNDVSMLQMNDWLAELRDDDDRARPLGHRRLGAVQRAPSQPAARAEPAAFTRLRCLLPGPLPSPGPLPAPSPLPLPSPLPAPSPLPPLRRLSSPSPLPAPSPLGLPCGP